MVIIEFMGPINREPIELDISTVKELSDFIMKDDTLSTWADSLAVGVNDEIVTDINFKLKDGDRVTLLPPVCGGWLIWNSIMVV